MLYILWFPVSVERDPPVTPIVRDDVHLNENVSGWAEGFIPGLNQQWALPVHSARGFSVDSSAGLKNMFTVWTLRGIYLWRLAVICLLRDLFLNMYQE